jgi:hypothetical protein
VRQRGQIVQVQHGLPRAAPVATVGEAVGWSSLDLVGPSGPGQGTGSGDGGGGGNSSSGSPPGPSGAVMLASQVGSRRGAVAPRVECRTHGERHEAREAHASSGTERKTGRRGVLVVLRDETVLLGAVLASKGGDQQARRPEFVCGALPLVLLAACCAGVANRVPRRYPGPVGLPPDELPRRSRPVAALPSSEAEPSAGSLRGRGLL